ncbi:glycerophosphodiester phosphodiesterase family protein [Microbacterium resistens]
MPRSAPARPPMPLRRSVAAGYRLSFRDLGRTILLVAVTQGVVALVAAPLLVGLFGLATRASGLTALTTTTIGTFLRNPAGIALAVLSLVLVVVALLLQAALYAAVAVHRLAADGRAPVAGEAAETTEGDRAERHDRSAERAGLRLVRRRVAELLRRPSSLLLVPYLLLLVPLGQAGIGSVLTRWVAVPAFVSDELLKEPQNAAAYLLILLVLWWLNLRLILTVPMLVLEPIGVGAALARSWRLTRWRSLRTAGLLIAVLVPMAVALGLIGLLTVLPVVVTDAVAPGSSPVVAAVALGIAQVLVLLTVGVFLMVQAQTLVTAAQAASRAPLPTSAAPAWPRVRRRIAATAVAAGLVVGAGGAGVAAGGTLAERADGATLVLAHRGFVDGGVENTIPALDAAHRAGADLVEMDVQQTEDGGWVLMHDADLRRLAGIDGSVGRMTTEEATAVTVRDEAGHRARIPSLEEYLRRADELDQALLIEVKLHGGESADYVRELLELIDRVDDARDHIYHSLSADAVARIKELRPDLTVGFIVPLAYGGVPETPADFLVLEQSAYDASRRDAVWDQGKGVLVWTVQDPAAMRALYRDNVDGIITDHPDTGLTERTAVAGETGMADRLGDAVDRLLATP